MHYRTSYLSKYILCNIIFHFITLKENQFNLPCCYKYSYMFTVIFCTSSHQIPKPDWFWLATVLGHIEAAMLSSIHVMKCMPYVNTPFIPSMNLMTKEMFHDSLLLHSYVVYKAVNNWTNKKNKLKLIYVNNSMMVTRGKRHLEDSKR